MINHTLEVNERWFHLETTGIAWAGQAPRWDITDVLGNYFGYVRAHDWHTAQVEAVEFITCKLAAMEEDMKDL